MKKLLIFSVISFNAVSGEAVDNAVCDSLIDRYNEIYTVMNEHRSLAAFNKDTAKLISTPELVNKRNTLSTAYGVIADGFEHSLKGYELAMKAYGCKVEFSD